MQDYLIIQFITKTSFRGAKNFHKTTTNAETLPEILESFERHLKGAGYIFEGRLDFVDDEDNSIRNALDEGGFVGYVDP